MHSFSKKKTLYFGFKRTKTDPRDSYNFLFMQTKYHFGVVALNTFSFHFFFLLLCLFFASVERLTTGGFVLLSSPPVAGDLASLDFDGHAVPKRSAFGVYPATSRSHWRRNATSTTTRR